MKKRLAIGLLTGLCTALCCGAPALADSRKVVTLGADLTEEQKNTMMRYFGVSYDGVDLIYINNTDEREHLGSYVPLEQIGNYTYSCALVSPTSSGGIQVKTANLDWVTCNMIASTLSTSGVTNCQVVAASPFKVSGTGALTGVIMAYETASQETLDPVKKDLANQELVATGNLANEVGQSKATAIINETKIEVVENNITNVQEINNIVNNVSNQYGVAVTPDQSMVIAELMQKIAEQEYDITQLKATLDMVQANVAGDAGASEEEQQAAEQKALESQRAAEQAAAAAQMSSDEYQALVDAGQDVTDVLPQEEDILNNTDVTVLETEGASVNEGDTTTTVLEQESEQAQTDNGLGIPEATADGTVTEPTEAQTEAGITIETDEAQTEAGITVETNEAQTEAVSEDMTEAGETEAFTEAVTETEEWKAENLPAEDKAVYDEVKTDMDGLFISTELRSEDGSYVMYLTEEASKKVPEALEQYLLKLMSKGTEAVAAEEAADVEIPQNIMEETAIYAEDRHYEDAQLAQMDKFVRRFVFKDSEKLLADSMLEDSDKEFLYEEIMKILEKAYKVEPEEAEETAEEFAEEVGAEEAPLEYAEEIPAEAEGTADEFADFEEQEGSF